MNTKNLETMYAGFDLHYERSDDHSVWSKGHKQWQAICNEERMLIDAGLTSTDELLVIKFKYFGDIK